MNFHTCFLLISWFLWDLEDTEHVVAITSEIYLFSGMFSNLKAHSLGSKIELKMIMNGVIEGMLSKDLRWFNENVIFLEILDFASIKFVRIIKRN